MSDTLYPYYERELRFFRDLAPEFAKLYPAAAGRLMLEANRSVDPHVERLIEAFALIAGRIHRKLDDEFPELTEALLSVLYPHYLAPVPSMAVVQFELDPARAQLPGGFLIDKHSQLHTQPVDGLPCRYRTGYPVTLWPVGLTEARLQTPPFPSAVNQALEPLDAESRRKIALDTKAVLRLRFDCQTDLPFADLELDTLRFYLSGDSQWIPTLYELLFNNVLQVVFRPLDGGGRQTPIALDPRDCILPVGFGREEGLLDYPNQSLLGYRLLTEYFAFPHKFLFFDLTGWRQAREAGFRRQVEVVFYLNRTVPVLEQAVDAQVFRTGCTPVINLFKQTAEPISLTHSRYEYRIELDVAHSRGLEVYSVDAVASIAPGGTATEYLPFYSFRHGSARESQQTFWYASRRPSLREGDQGTDVYLNLVDLGFNPRLPAESVLVVNATATNRDLPAKLQQAGTDLQFALQAAAPLANIHCLRSPSSPLRPPLRRGAHWRLVSHLNLNHLSLTDPVEGRRALQEILKLYDFSGSVVGEQMAAVTQQLIEGITSLSSRRCVARTGAEISSGFCRGVELTIEFDEQKYVGSGLYLFACVLERFLGLYVSINSFSQLVAKTKQSEGVLKKWPPRAGELQLL